MMPAGPHRMQPSSSGSGSHPAYQGLSKQRVDSLRSKAFDTLGSLVDHSPEEVLHAAKKSACNRTPRAEPTKHMRPSQL
eukprot:3988641-Amphidinium_carterae.1